MTEEVKRNYLEINSLQDLKECNNSSVDLSLNLLDPINFQLNKFFYKNVGKKHRWVDRLSWDEKIWIDYVEDSKVKTFVLQDKEDLIGYFEQIFHVEKKSCEIAYFGILKEHYGKKYGGFLLTEAIKNSFNNGIEKVWVHTCSLDHKNALNNYQARGMKIFKSETVNLNIS